MTEPITHERLLSLLDYDPETGEFVRACPGPGWRKGDTAGTINSRGYQQIRLDGRLYYGHRLAWFYMTKVWAGIVDHREGKSDRFDNLRATDTTGNNQNIREAFVTNGSGLLGVSKSPWPDHPTKGWRARIMVDGKRKFLGYFATAELAHSAYVDAKRQLHPTCTI